MNLKFLLACTFLLTTCISLAQGIHKINGLDLFIAANSGANFVKFDSEVAEEITTGKKIDLATLTNKSLPQPGKPTLIIIWATPDFSNCPPCNRYKEALYSSKIDTAFNVITIAVVNEQKTTKTQQEFMNTVKQDKRFYNLKILASSGGPIAKLKVAPYTYVMNAQGQMIYKYQGYNNDIFSKLLHFKNLPLGKEYKYLKEDMFVNNLAESDEYIETKNEDGLFKIEKFISKTKTLESEKYMFRSSNTLELHAYFKFNENSKLIFIGKNMAKGKGFLIYHEEERGDYNTKTKSFDKSFKKYVYLLVNGEVDKDVRIPKQVNDSLVYYSSDTKYGLLNIFSHEITIPAEYDEILPIGGDLYIVGKDISNGTSYRPWKYSIIDKNKNEIIPYFFGRLKLVRGVIVKEKIDDTFKQRAYEILDKKGKSLGSYDNENDLNNALSKINGG